MRRKEQYAVLLDTSFLIRLLSEKDALHSNALGYFRYFLENGIPMYISTIAIAEYCVIGSIEELPLKDMRILPFNIMHATIAGRMASIMIKARKEDNDDYGTRPVVLNDVKMLSQAQSVEEISMFVTSDSRSAKIFRRIDAEFPLKFEHVDIHEPHCLRFGELDFEGQ